MLYSQLYFKGTEVHMEWVPSHCGLRANEVVDKAAKHALIHAHIDIENKLNKNESNSILKAHFQRKWQKRWDETNSPLKGIQPLISMKYRCTLNHRSSESILRCLRMGNIGLNDNLLLFNKHETGLCSNCDVAETTTHFLIECPKYLIERTMLLVETNYYAENDIVRLLSSSENEHQKALVAFVRRTQRIITY